MLKMYEATAICIAHSIHSKFFAEAVPLL